MAESIDRAINQGPSAFFSTSHAIPSVPTAMEQPIMHFLKLYPDQRFESNRITEELDPKHHHHIQP